MVIWRQQIVLQHPIGLRTSQWARIISGIGRQIHCVRLHVLRCVVGDYLGMHGRESCTQRTTRQTNIVLSFFLQRRKKWNWYISTWCVLNYWHHTITLTQTRLPYHIPALLVHASYSSGVQSSSTSAQFKTSVLYQQWWGDLCFMAWSNVITGKTFTMKTRHPGLPSLLGRQRLEDSSS